MTLRNYEHRDTIRIFILVLTIAFLFTGWEIRSQALWWSYSDRLTVDRQRSLRRLSSTIQKGNKMPRLESVPGVEALLRVRPESESVSEGEQAEEVEGNERRVSDENLSAPECAGLFLRRRPWTTERGVDGKTHDSCNVPKLWRERLEEKL